MFVVTSSTTVGFLAGFSGYLSRHGATVLIAADGVGSGNSVVSANGLLFQSVRMRREPRPLQDISSLLRMVRVVRGFRPDLLVYATPKASLFASLAGLVNRVPVRVYQLWGLRLETVAGWRRLILGIAERLTSHHSTAVLANSRSLAKRYQELRLNCGVRVDSLGQGSSHGVDIDYYSPSRQMPSLSQSSAAFLASSSGLIVGYVGRIHPDKGIDTLLSAATRLGELNVPIRLLLIGRDEGAALERELATLPSSVRVHCVGHVSDLRPYYAVMDVLVLASRREGFPNVVLEAAAMHVPAVVSDATGAIDSVVDGVTGYVVPVNDPVALSKRLHTLSKNRQVLEWMGERARQHVELNYAQEDVWQRHFQYLLECMAGGGSVSLKSVDAV